MVPVEFLKWPGHVAVPGPALSRPRFVLPLGVEYLVVVTRPLRSNLNDLARYLDGLSDLVEVSVLDFSPRDSRADHARQWPVGVRQVPAEQIDSVFDVGAARFDSLVVAGDDVRYTPGELVAVVEGLREHDLVVPTSVDQSRGWQHRADTAASLLRRAVGRSDSVTYAARRYVMSGAGVRSVIDAAEVSRVVRRRGGRVLVLPAILITRRPSSSPYRKKGRLPERRAASFGRAVILPALVGAACRRWWVLPGGVAVAVGMAEFGRRRHGGGSAFSPGAPMWAPVWLGRWLMEPWLHWLCDGAGDGCNNLSIHQELGSGAPRTDTARHDRSLATGGGF